MHRYIQKQEQTPSWKYWQSFFKNKAKNENNDIKNINGEGQRSPLVELLIEEVLRILEFETVDFDNEAMQTSPICKDKTGVQTSPLNAVHEKSAELLIEEVLRIIEFETVDFNNEVMQTSPICNDKTGVQTSPLNAEKSAACSKPSQQLDPSNSVPVIVEACLQYFNTHATDCVGIFRVPGSRKRVSKMVDHMVEHPVAWTSINCVNVFMRNHPEFTAHDVSSFLKRFIKFIVGNQAVIAYNCQGSLIDLIRNKCPSHLIAKKCRRVLGQLLIPARRLLLARLCTFLHEFSKHEATTKMNCANLAVCFANLMQPPLGDNEQSTKGHKKMKSVQTAEEICALMRAEAEKTKLCVSVIQILIEQSHHVFRTQRVCPAC